jgi:transposase InsO family protein
MNVVDSITKHVHFIPMHTTIMTKGTARLYLREVWKHHGMPQVVLSDRGSQFTAGFTGELYKLLGIKLATSTAYHPQTDSQTEHINQESMHVHKSMTRRLGKSPAPRRVLTQQ